MISLRSRLAYVAATFACFVFALVIGCGGGGGGSTGGGGTTYSNNTPAVFLDSGHTQPAVPNVLPGGTIFLSATATATSSSGSSTVAITPTNFVVAGGAAVATVSSSGLLTVVTNTLGPFTVTAASAAGSLSWTINVISPNEPVFNGVVTDGTNGVAGVVVAAYNSAGLAVGSGTSISSGAVAVTATSDAVRFSVVTSGIDPSHTTYFPIFNYNLFNYTANPTFPLAEATCDPPLPAYVSGTLSYTLPNPIILFPRSNAPPAPASCVGP